MGNTTVTPATSRAPIIPATSVKPRTSVSIFNRDIHTPPPKSLTPSISSNSPTSVVPDTSTTVHISDIPRIPVTSPTFAFPVVSPVLAVPIISPTPTAPVISTTTAIAIVSPNSAIPIVSPTTAIPVESRTSVVPVVSPIRETSREPRTSVVPVVSPIRETPREPRTSVVPVVSPTREIPRQPRTSVVPVVSSIHEIPKVSSTAAIPVNSETPAAPIVSPIPVIPIKTSALGNPVVSSTPEIPIVSPPPTAPVVSFWHEIPVTSPTSYINGFVVISPDTSAVSPTLDLPITPIASPTPTDAIIPVKPIINEIRSTASVTHDTASTSIIPVASNTPVISKPPRPTKIDPKRRVSKNSIISSTSTLKQTRPTTLSFVDRSNKWNKFDQKQQEKPKRLFFTTQRAPSLSKSITSSSRNTNADQKITPIIPNIIAVPSFPLRSTAVCNPPQNDYILSERTQSIHNDISIFKYYLTYNEKKRSIGDHTKATMFKMDTRLKQTPLPTPTLLFLTKNFSDGTDETNDKSTFAPTFDSLGLQNNFETEPIDESLKKSRLHEKQQQRKLRRQTSLLSNDASDSIDSIQFVTSTIISQPNSLIQNNRQPITSILKKPPSQLNNNNPFSTQTNSKIFQEIQKNDYENYSSIVSFNLPLLTPQKASQSISRSEKLIHRKK